jgi:hypothetical protein
MSEDHIRAVSGLLVELRELQARVEKLRADNNELQHEVDMLSDMFSAALDDVLHERQWFRRELIAFFGDDVPDHFAEFMRLGAQGDENLIEKFPPATDGYQDLLGDIWLYVNWRQVTRNLTTEQKELWAAAIEASSHRSDPGLEVTVDRWWRGEAMP